MNSGFRGTGGRSRLGGFTLIELLITLAVIAIAIGVGVPMYGTFTQESSVSGATSELIAAMSDARTRAATERSTIRLQAIDDDWSNGWESVRVSDGELLFRVARADKSVLITEADDETTIDFDAEGRAQVREFDIRIDGAEAGSPVRALELGLLGRVEIEKGYVTP